MIEEIIRVKVGQYGPILITIKTFSVGVQNQEEATTANSHKLSSLMFSYKIQHDFPTSGFEFV